MNRPRVTLDRVNISLVNEKIFTMGSVEGIYTIVQYPLVSGIARNLRIQIGSILQDNEKILDIDRNRGGLDYQFSPLLSTTTGVVTELYIQNGDVLTTETPVCKIVQMEYVKIQASIMDSDLSRVYEGMPALISVSAYQDVFQGYVHKVYPVVNPSTRTVTVEIYRNNSDRRLRPGMYAEVEIILDTAKQIILLPIKAILFDNSVKYVYIFNPADNIVRLQEIFTGEIYGDAYEVITGLRGGEIYVIEGKEYCYSGEMVDPVNLMNILQPSDIDYLEENQDTQFQSSDSLGPVIDNE